jgi:hypothetical protein
MFCSLALPVQLPAQAPDHAAKLSFVGLWGTSSHHLRRRREQMGAQLQWRVPTLSGKQRGLARQA